MKEAPKFIFNSNLFKNVKFGENEEDIKKDEELVENCAKFLKENCLDKLIKSLELVEGVPTDSDSLETTFHSHGVNMRYLGMILDMVKDKKSRQIFTMLEKEVVLRAYKHILNE